MANIKDVKKIVNGNTQCRISNYEGKTYFDGKIDSIPSKFEFCTIDPDGCRVYNYIFYIIIIDENEKDYYNI